MRNAGRSWRCGRGKDQRRRGRPPLGFACRANQAASAPAGPRPTAPKFLRVIIRQHQRLERSPVPSIVALPIDCCAMGQDRELIHDKCQERVNEELHKNGVNFDISEIKPGNLIRAHTKG